MDKITEIEQRIKRNKEAMQMVKEEYIRANAPMGYRNGTSYLDADMIHGSKREYDPKDMVESLRILEHLIYIDNIILENYKKQDRVEKKLGELKMVKDKVYYLREAEGYTQEKAAGTIGISCRHLQRLEAEINKKYKNN